MATWRRPQGLARLLDSLVRQKLPADLSLEVIVVDNDAEGTAEPVLARFRETLPLRALCEPRRNISHARNLALCHARGSWLAFVDDDEVACEDWLGSYWRQVQGGDADVWLGPVVPELETGPGAWQAAARFHASRRFATGARVGLAEARTSNALVRRALLDVRRFDPELGRCGGGDTELFARLLRAGAEFRWCNEAVVFDRIPVARQRPRWLLQRALRGGLVTTRLERRRRPGLVADLERGARALCALGVCAAATPPAALAGRTPALRALMRAAVQAGHLCALLGVDYEEYRGDP